MEYIRFRFFFFLFTLSLYQLVSELGYLAFMAPDTRSKDHRIGDLEQRLENQFSLMESNCERLDKNVADVGELRNSIGESSLTLMSVRYSLPFDVDSGGGVLAMIFSASEIGGGSTTL